MSKVKTRKYSLGSSYSWRIGKFYIGEQYFRVWVRFRADVEQYAAILGLEDSGDMTVLARYEFHGTHPGWHVHAACKNEQSIVSGRLFSQLHSRFPLGSGFHRSTEFRVTEENAAAIAVDKFGLYGPGRLL